MVLTLLAAAMQQDMLRRHLGRTELLHELEAMKQEEKVLGEAAAKAASASRGSRPAPAQAGGGKAGKDHSRASLMDGGFYRPPEEPHAAGGPSMVEAPPWQCPSSSGRARRLWAATPGTPRAKPSQPRAKSTQPGWIPATASGGSSEPPPKPPISPRNFLVIQTAAASAVSSRASASAWARGRLPARAGGPSCSSTARGR